MALSRTSQRALDVRLHPAPDTDTDDAVSSCLVDHIHHLRTISYYSRKQIIPFGLPAPLLEMISAAPHDSDVREDFLGGRVGRLRTLTLESTRLPETCPALVTVECLSLDIPASPEHAESFGRLFQLFPSLRSLSLSHLEPHHARILPSGPAPRTLERLYLRSSSSDYDLVRHYVDWQEGCILRDVSLEVDDVLGPNFDGASFISGAIKLTFKVGWRDSRFIFTASLPGSERRVEFDDDGDDDNNNYGRCVADVILRARGGLCGSVRRLGIPAAALKTFLELGVLRELTQLARLELEIMGPPEREYEWEPLNRLAEVNATCPRLASVAIIVETWDSDDEDVSPNTHDASAFLAKLAQLDPSTLPKIEIEGFSGSILQSVPMPDLSGLRIEFKTSP
ncbi:hypothetical protein AURDEDRAFT_170824 [Auricularia subglabra TFB-10046 SS5]|nr:hypothetical protein AURDEDRAFT_170824 [Auricularia subglabra TFB-10046 SS5]